MSTPRNSRRARLGKLDKVPNIITVLTSNSFSFVFFVCVFRKNFFLIYMLTLSRPANNSHDVSQIFISNNPISRTKTNFLIILIHQKISTLQSPPPPPKKKLVLMRLNYLQTLLKICTKIAHQL